MPELPDVETFIRYVKRTALHAKIKAVDIHSPQITADTSSRSLIRQLKGNTPVHAARHGKYMSLAMKKGGCLIVHFGMTGYIKYAKTKPDDLKYVRVTFTFSNGYHLFYICKRLLGKLQYSQSLDSFIRKKKLGPDALRISRKDFKERMAGSKAALKTTLMNQSILAGIGNIYADEILYQSRLHPRKKTDTLSEAEIRNLFTTMKEVIRVAVKKKADPEKMPKDYLLPHRSEDGRCPRRGHGKIKRISINSRSAYYCPKCQKK